MGRTLQGLVKALDEIEEVRKEFYSDLRVVGQADDLNTELEYLVGLPGTGCAIPGCPAWFID